MVNGAELGQKNAIKGNYGRLQAIIKFRINSMISVFYAYM